MAHMIFDLTGGLAPEPRLTDAEKRQAAKCHLLELAEERKLLSQRLAHEATVFNRARHQYYDCARHMEQSAKLAGLDPLIMRAFLVGEDRAEPDELIAQAEAFKEHEERCQAGLIEALRKAAAEETD